MKKNIWIFNHYATTMYLEQGGRHYWFAKYLKKAGYNPVIFCASTMHGLQEEIDIKGERYIVERDKTNEIPFVFIKVPAYKGNGLSRIKNMVTFYRKLFPVAKIYAKKNGKPDIIYASSVHPLTLVAGIQIVKKLGIRCICEVRDLWPKSIVAYGKLKEKSVLAQILYQGEKWIYKNADALIFTMEGGKDYIIEKRWDCSNNGPIDLEKVFYINNGIDLPMIMEQRELYPYQNERYTNISKPKVIYTGSIREANDVGKILDTAKYLKDSNVMFCVFGDGEEREKLEKRVAEENIDNLIFFGKVSKKYIPYIVHDALLLLLLYSRGIAEVAHYGMSQNKMFDYLASGRPIISNLPNRYSIINQYVCGVERDIPTAKELAEEIKRMVADKEKLKQWGENSARAAKEFSFEEHTRKLIQIIEHI